MVVNRAGAGQGYQIQATRWRELSILLGVQWYIFNMITFFTELTHQSDAELVTMKVCRVYHHVSPRRVSPDLGWVIQVFRYKIVSPRCDRPSWIWSLPKRITRLRLGDTVSLLQNRITKPYLRLGDTLQLRSGYTRQGDFSK